LAHNGITIAGRSPTSVNASMGRRKDVVISGAGTTRPAPGPNRAEDLLAERFARGEIDEDEFRRRMALLREHR